MPPPQANGADWPAIQYGQSTSNELPLDELTATIEQMVGRCIPTSNATAVHQKWFFRNIWWPERNSRELAFRLYRASGGCVNSFDDWWKGRGQSDSDPAVVDLRRFDRNRYLYDVAFGKLYRQSGWAHNGFLPAVWMEKTALNLRWLEYFLSTRRAGSVQLFTVTTRRVPVSQYQATFAWFKEAVLPLLRKAPRQFGGELIFWRMDWGRLKRGAMANFHFHVAVMFPDEGGGVSERCWRLRAELKDSLGGQASVYFSARETGDARRLASYLFLPHSARDYAKLTDAELLDFFRAVERVRKYQFCGSLYRFVCKKCAEGITSVSRRLTEDGKWEFRARRAEPKSDDSRDDLPPPNGEYFDYHLRPFVCALAHERYSLCLAVMPRHGGKIDLEKIRNHPWIASLAERAYEAMARQSANIQSSTSIHPQVLLTYFWILASRRSWASRDLPRGFNQRQMSLGIANGARVLGGHTWWCWRWPWPWRCWWPRLRCQRRWPRSRLGATACWLQGGGAKCASFPPRKRHGACGMTRRGEKRGE